MTNENKFILKKRITYSKRGAIFNCNDLVLIVHQQILIHQFYKKKGLKEYNEENKALI